MIGTSGCLMRVLALCVCAHLGWAGPAPRPSPTLHLHLSPQELRETFAVEHHSDVPEYDLFHVRSVRRRSVRTRRRVHVRAFGNEIDLDLELNHNMHSDVRMFFADTSESGGDVTIERVRGDTEFNVGELFQDVERQAALLVSHAADDTLQINGVVDDLVVAPAPLRLQQHFPAPSEDGMAFIDEHVEEDLDVMNDTDASYRGKRDIEYTRGLHVVYRLKDQPGVAGGELLNLEDDEAFLEPGSEYEESFMYGVNDIPGVNYKATNRSKRNTLSTDLYPEVIVIVDYETYAVHNYNAQTAKKYIMSFMNAVNMRYKSASFPSISIHVAGIVISKSKKATPYLEENMVEDGALDAIAALASIGRYLYDEHRLPSYDAALVMTKRDMCTRNRQWGSCNKVTAGYAYVGGGCSISRYFNKINSVALVEDSAGFSGIIVATHEIGHLLGAVHDGSPPASYLGGPGALSCPWEDGYIMSDMRRDYKGLQWSVCTMNQFNHFAIDRRSKCMRNLPTARQGLSKLPKQLPGQLISLDAQCKRDRGSSACFKDHRVCTELYCFESSTGYCVSFRPAAEGSSCGEGMYCKDGFCQPKDFIY